MYVLAASIGVVAMTACSGGWGERPEVVRGPANQTVIAGQTATFSVSAAGTAPLSYQWAENGVALKGATGLSYTTPSTSGGDNGSVFTVTVTNAVGGTTSASATLTVDVPPAVVQPPQSQTVTAGQMTTFNVTATGTAPLSYQWFKNGVPIAGATASSYTTMTSGSDSGAVFTAVVSNLAGTVTTYTATLTVNVSPTITLQPVNDTVDAGASASFHAAAKGTAPISYQWYRSGVAIPGATGSTYTTAATVSGDSGSTYSVVTTNVAGTAASAMATLTVNVGPVFTTQPQSQTAIAGQTATFNATASGTGPIAYQWYANGVAIGGATANFYTTPALSQGSNGTLYTVTATNMAGTMTSMPATLTVNVPPTISVQPANATVTAGAPAAFSVVATGTGPFSYQWYRNGVPISGATSSAYATPATVSGDSGAMFTVSVTNAAGTVTSVAGALTVNSPPTIVAQPVSQTVTVPQTATFSVVAAGTGPLSYQWYKNGAAISGAMASAYTTPATTSGSQPVYTVAVTNAEGSVTSAGAVLTVNNTPLSSNSLACSAATAPFNGTVTVVPTFAGGTAVIGTSGYGSSDVSASALSGTTYTSAGITAPTTFTLTVTAAGGGATVNTCNVTPTPVAITPVTPATQTLAPGSLTFSATASGGVLNTVTWSATGGSFSGNVWTSPTTPGTYTITATSVDDPAVHMTTTATVTVPVITTQPLSKNACAGYSPSLNIGANYASAYQWSFDGGAVAGNSSTLTLSNVTTSNSGTYSCAVSNAAGSVTSNTVSIKVVNPTTLAITTQPSSLTVYATQTATFFVAASGTGTLTYQWYQGAVGTGTPINGATSSSYTTSALTVANSGTSYYVAVTDPDCTSTTVVSTAATVTVSGADTAVPPTITNQPAGVSAQVGGPATFTVGATGGGTLTYQWYHVPYSSTELTAPTAGSPISGATASTYVVPSTETAQSNDGDTYYVVVTNPYGSAVSNRAVLAVGAGIVLQINAEPQTDYVAVNTLASFSTTATCTGCIPAYQWYWYAPGATTANALTDQAVSSGVLSGATVSGSATSSLTLENVPATASGALFYVVVTSTSDGSTQIAGTNPLTSSTAGLFVGALGTVGASSPGSGLCNSSSNSWVLNGNNPGTAAGDVPYQNTTACTIQLTNDQGGEHAAVYWPTLISTAKFSVSFTVALTATNGTPADGFTMVMADSSQGATTASLGADGQGLGADGIPGFVLGFDTYQNGDKQTDPTCGACDPVPVPYMAVGQGASSLWENPWSFVNGELDTQNSTDYTPMQFANATHSYVVTVVNGIMTVTMDGYELFTGTVTLPPNAYLGFTASTGGAMESVTFSNLTATVSAP